MRSVFARIAFRSIGFGMSVWQQATEYLMCSISNSQLSADYADYTDRKIRDLSINEALIFFCFCLNQRNLCNLRINQRTMNAPIDGTGDVTARVLYFSIYLWRSPVNG